MEPEADSAGISGKGEDSARERNWLPLVVAAALVATVVVAGLVVSGRPRVGGNGPVLSPIHAAVDPYAPSLPLTNITMSEAANMAGGKMTYLDGHIANLGQRTVSGITVQVLFRNYAGEVAQNETLPVALIRTREPYVDTEPVAAAPLKPGAEQDFRLIFDKVSADWAGATPEIRILRVESK